MSRKRELKKLGSAANMIKTVAQAICKSRTCEGINCCQWPCNGGRWRDQNNQPGACRVEEGRYDDAAREAIGALREPTDQMIYYAEGYADFMLPECIGGNTKEARLAEMKMAYQVAIDVALGETP